MYDAGWEDACEYLSYVVVSLKVWAEPVAWCEVCDCDATASAESDLVVELVAADVVSFAY